MSEKHRGVTAGEIELDPEGLVRKRREVIAPLEPAPLGGPPLLGQASSVHLDRERELRFRRAYREREAQLRRSQRLAPERDTGRRIDRDSDPAVAVNGKIAGFRFSTAVKNGRFEAAEIRERWRAAAPGWGTHGALVREMTAPVSAAMVEMGEPAGDERWLDVAAGVGDPALDVARSLGAGGFVVTTDPVLEMVRVARRAVRKGGAPARVAAVVAAAEAMPFAGSFAGLTCRFGAMFFADPPRALAALRSTLEPGGRGVFAVWAEREGNPFFQEVNEAVRAMVPDAPVPAPDDPHGFRYAAEGSLAKLLAEKGSGQGLISICAAGGQGVTAILSR